MTRADDDDVVFGIHQLTSRQQRKQGQGDGKTHFLGSLRYLLLNSPISIYAAGQILSVLVQQQTTNGLELRRIKERLEKALASQGRQAKIPLP